MKRENFYRRDPAKALAGMVGLNLEERAVYGTIIDLLYVLWRPIEDDRRYLAGWCGCAVQKLNPIVERLIQKGRIIRIKKGGRTYLSDDKFEEERASVKGPTKRSDRVEVGEKSGGVEEKSASVGQNPPTCENGAISKQGLIPLEKTREDKRRHLPAEEPAVAIATPAETRPEPWMRDRAYVQAWDACTPEMRKRSKAREKTWPEWKRAVGRAGGPGRLLLALKAYVAEDEDAKRTGGPGFDRWLRDGKWESWLPAGPNGASAEPSQAVEAQHLRWITEWRNNPATWKRDQRGPRPGEPFCKVAPDLLRRLSVRAHGDPPPEVGTDIFPFPPALSVSAA